MSWEIWIWVLMLRFEEGTRASARGGVEQEQTGLCELWAVVGLGGSYKCIIGMIFSDSFGDRSVDCPSCGTTRNVYLQA